MVNTFDQTRDLPRKYSNCNQKVQLNQCVRPNTEASARSRLSRDQIRVQRIQFGSFFYSIIPIEIPLPLSHSYPPHSPREIGSYFA